jgi:hypothetical protein
MLAEHGLNISAGKMSGLWSGNPASQLDDLDVICAVLGCDVGELLTPGSTEVTRPAGNIQVPQAAASASAGPAVVPKRREGRSLPPV